MKVNINNNVDIIDSDHDNNHEQVSTDSTQGVITSTTTTFPGDSVEARGLLYDVITQYIYIYIYIYIHTEREREEMYIYIYIHIYIYIYIHVSGWRGGAHPGAEPRRQQGLRHNITVYAVLQYITSHVSIFHNMIVYVSITVLHNMTLCYIT